MYWVFKRSFDFLLAFLMLIPVLPILMVISLLIIFDSGFPVFFFQERVGKNGVLFKLFKFRSMRVAIGAEGGQFDAGDQSRVTRIGKFLRKTKLDELPQLFNVLRGEMSLVGPRPEVKKWVDKYPERWQFVLSVRPGITDPASVEFRNEEEILSRSIHPELTYQDQILPRKLDLYEEYVRNCSIKLDLKILLFTGWVVLTK